ncbi:MAG: DUF1801 domain-containing protein [Armatimonadetes bacterium]|nr:DUF1801 domain-containing protein [Armatimonadota bacterium]
MQSAATTVDDYISESPADRHEALNKLRKLCVEYFPDYQEGMNWGMAVYTKGDRHVAFASQKNFIALYGVSSTVQESDPELLIGLNCGKGCIRFANVKKMDFALIEKLIKIRAKSQGKEC